MALPSVPLPMPTALGAKPAGWPARACPRVTRVSSMTNRDGVASALLLFRSMPVVGRLPGHDRPENRLPMFPVWTRSVIFRRNMHRFSESARRTGWSVSCVAHGHSIGSSHWNRESILGSKAKRQQIWMLQLPCRNGTRFGGPWLRYA